MKFNTINIKLNKISRVVIAFMLMIMMISMLCGSYTAHADDWWSMSDHHLYITGNIPEVSEWPWFDELNSEYWDEAQEKYVKLGLGYIQDVFIDSPIISECSDLSGMFKGLYSLSSIDISNLDTSHVTSMSSMFQGCSGLGSITFGDVNTESVTDMSSMFEGCYKLAELDLSSFSTNNVVDMNSMFQRCYDLTDLDLNGFNTDQVSDMSNMFAQCGHLNSLDLSSFNTQNVSSMKGFLDKDYRLSTLILGSDFSFQDGSYVPYNVDGNISTFKVEKIPELWLDLSSGQKVLLESNDITSGPGIFQRTAWWHVEGDTLIIGTGDEIWLPELNPNYAIESFPWCNTDHESFSWNNGNFSVSDVYREQWSDVTNVRFDGIVHMNCSTEMFSRMPYVKSIDTTGLDISEAKNADGMFKYCYFLESLDVSQLDTSKLTTAEGMFTNTYQLREITLGEKFGFRNGMNQKVIELFDSSKSAWQLDYGSQIMPGTEIERYFDISKNTMSGTWRYIGDWWNIDKDSGELTIGIDGFEIQLPEKDDYDDWPWYEDREEIKSVKFVGDLIAGETLASMFEDCENLESVDMTNLNTGSVKDMSNMFKDCEKLASVKLDELNTEFVTDMSSMFSGCSALENLDISSFAVGGRTDTDDMFEGTKLKTVVLGPQFRFNGTMLPTPPSDESTERWVSENGDYGPYTPEELTRNYDGSIMSGTWLWDTSPRYTIHFTANVNTTGSMPDQMADVAENVQINECNFQAYNMEFARWEVVGSNPVITYSDKGTIPANTYNAGDEITLKAIFRSDVTVSYRVNHYQQEKWMVDTLMDDDQTTDPYGYKLYESTTGSCKYMDEIKPEVKTYDGFVSPSAQTVVIDQDNKEINYFYDREYYYIVFDGNGATSNQWEQDQDKLNGGAWWYIEDSSTYDWNVGTRYESGALPAQIMFINSRDELIENPYVKDECEFLGWNTNSTGSGVGYSNKQSVLNAARSGDALILFAQWKDNSQQLEQNTDGSMRVRAKGGEEVVINGLPAGTKYEVTEVNVPKGWTNVDTQQEISGKPAVITPNGVNVAKVTNEYYAEGVATITAHKQLIGEQLTAGSFNFKLLDANGDVVDIKSNGDLDMIDVIADDEGTSATANPWYQTAPIVFNTMKFDSEGVYTYTIEEVPGSDDTIIYDTHQETVMIAVADNGDGTMRCVTSYDEDGALFVNTKKDGGLLTIQKEVLNTTEKSKNQTFNFIVDVQTENGSVLNKALEYSIVDVEDPSNPVTTGGTLRSGESIALNQYQTATISGIPYHATYTVTEEAVDGWEMVNSANAAGTMESETIDVKFTNVYSTIGEFAIAATFELIGEPITENAFAFELRNSAGEIVETVYSTVGGNVKFSPFDLSYDNDGRTYYYYISHRNDELDHIIYDGSTKEVKVVVEDDGHGKMAATITNAPDGNHFIDIAEADLIVVNKITGKNSDPNKEFTFQLTLTDADNAPIDDLEAPESIKGWANEGNGVYSFVLGNNGQARFVLPTGTKWSVGADSDGYVCTSTVSNEVVPRLRGRALTAEKNGEINPENGDTTVTFTMRRTVILPTGIASHLFESLIIVGIAIVGLTTWGVVTIVQKKRRKKGVS